MTIISIAGEMVSCKMSCDNGMTSVLKAQCTDSGVENVMWRLLLSYYYIHMSQEGFHAFDWPYLSFMPLLSLSLRARSIIDVNMAVLSLSGIFSMSALTCGLIIPLFSSSIFMWSSFSIRSLIDSSVRGLPHWIQYFELDGLGDLQLRQSLAPDKP